MASEQEEQRRADMLRERREAGDKAWSPSRAREALRSHISGAIRIYESFRATKRAIAKGQKIATPAQWLETEAEEIMAFDSSDAFKLFCREHLADDGFMSRHGLS